MKLSLLLTQYLGFVTLGMAMSVVGPLVPATRGEIPMSYLQAGTVLSGQFLGMLVTVPFGGHLADRFGKKAFLLGSGLVFAAGLFGCAASRSFPALLSSCVVAGIGGGGYEVGINALQADHAGVDSGKAMNLLHFFYGVGAIAGPILAGVSVENGFGWRAAFAACAVLPAAVTLVLLPQRVGAAAPAAAREPAELYRSGTLWLFGLVLAVYVGIESSVYSWISTFWHELPESRFVAAPFVASLFWITLTAGRLLCGRFTDWLGHVRYVAFASATTMAVSLAWAISPTPPVTLLCVFLFGLSLAGIFPTAMAFATGSFPGDSGKVVAFLAIFGSAGGFLIPSLIGRTADAVGMGALPPSIALLSLLMFAGARLADSRSAQRPARRSRREP